MFDTLHVIGAHHQKPGAQALADRVSKTWASFARTGQCDWPAYTADKRTTMVFDDNCRTVDDPDGAVRPLWAEAASSG